MTPLEYRKGRAIATASAGVERRGIPFAGTEIRSVQNGTGGTKLRLTGYASVTESPYTLCDAGGEFTETIARGAFTKTIADGADVQLKVDHEGVSMARTRSGTMKLSEDGTGLHVEARIDPKRPDVKILRSAIESGDVDEWSFAFRVSPNGDDWSSDYTTRRIMALSLHNGDVSVCNHGANPATGTIAPPPGIHHPAQGCVARVSEAASRPKAASVKKPGSNAADTSGTLSAPTGGSGFSSEPRHQTRQGRTPGGSQGTGRDTPTPGCDVEESQRIDGRGGTRLLRRGLGLVEACLAALESQASQPSFERR